MGYSKLFSLGDKDILEDTEEISLKGKEDEEIRKIILDNFSKLFPPQYFELFDKGNEYKLPIFGKIRKPDSLVYCKSEKRLWIFEYKSRTDEKLIDQVRKYRDGLQNEDISLYKLLSNWNEQFNKQRKIEDFKNIKPKIICIAPEFDEHAIEVEEKWKKEEIHLIKLTKHKDKEGNLFVLLQSRNRELLDFSNIKEINELKKWINQEIGSLADEGLLTVKEIETGWDFYSEINRKEPILSVRSQNQDYPKPAIFLVNPSEFLVKKYSLIPLAKKKEKSESLYKGTHRYSIEIETNEGFIRAKQLITEFIKEKINK